MGLPRYYLVYGSLLFPGPLFLFLVGFCLPISYHGSAAGAGGPVEMLRKYGRRGLGIAGAGLLLNLLVFREDPIWSWGVLQTIGVSIAVLAPAMPLLRVPRARWTLLALAALFYLTFFWTVPTLQVWVRSHPVAARLWFLEFPPWPWLAGPVIGMVVGWWWLDARRQGDAAERRYFVNVTLTALACLAAYCAWEWLLPTRPAFEFGRDLTVNRHWTPRGATILLITGTVAALLGAAYWVQEVHRRQLAWLAVLGRTALVLYFLHHFLVLTLVNQTLGIRFHDWPSYVLANLALMVVLVWLGRAWLWLSARTRRLSARLQTAWRREPDRLSSG